MCNLQTFDPVHCIAWSNHLVTAFCIKSYGRHRIGSDYQQLIYIFPPSWPQRRLDEDDVDPQKLAGPAQQIHVMWFCPRLPPVHNQMESNLAEKLDSFLGSEGQLNGAEPSLHLWNVLQMRDVAKVHSLQLPRRQMGSEEVLVIHLLSPMSPVLSQTFSEVNEMRWVSHPVQVRRFDALPKCQILITFSLQQHALGLTKSSSEGSVFYLPAIFWAKLILRN